MLLFPEIGQKTCCHLTSKCIFNRPNTKYTFFVYGNNGHNLLVNGNYKINLFISFAGLGITGNKSPN